MLSGVDATKDHLESIFCMMNCMEDGDWENIDALRQSCRAQELADTWYPFFQNCPACKGYIFGKSEMGDVAKQFGTCGCVVSLEMELRTAPLPVKEAAPTTKALKVGSTQSDKLVEALLAQGARGDSTREQLYYLHAARQASSRACSQRALPRVTTRAMKTRYRMPRDRAVAAK